MIYSLTGRITALFSDSCVIECGGVGFLVYTSSATLGQLTGMPDEVTLFTSMSVREDDISLYGFISPEELQAYKLLISVSGVGPKAALAILSVMSPKSFAAAVATGDTKAFTAAKGVGAKVAQRITMELKDKVAKETDLLAGEDMSSFVPQGANADEAVLALSSLGYTRSEAAHAISGAPDGATTEELIKLALKNLAR